MDIKNGSPRYRNRKKITSKNSFFVFGFVICSRIKKDESLSGQDVTLETTKGKKTFGLVLHV